MATLASSSALFLAARVAKMGMVLGVSWILAHTLGPEDRGQYGLLLLASPFLFKLSNLGMSGANTVLVAREPHRAAAAAATALWGGLGLGTLAAGAAALSFPLWGPRVLGMPVLDARLGLVLALVPLGVAASQLEGVFQAQKRFGLVNAVHLGATAAFLGLLAWLLLDRDAGIRGAVWALAFQAVLILALYAISAGRSLLARPDPAFFKAQLGFGLSLEAVNLMALAATHASSFLLTPCGVAAAAIGNYFVAKGLAEQTWILSDSATAVLLPGLSGLPREDARATAARACRMLLLIQVAGAVAAWAAAVVLVPWVLPKYTHVASTIAVLLPGTVLAVIPKVLSCYSLAVGRPLTGLWVTGAGMVMAFTAAALLIPRFGIQGAVGATALGYLAEAAVAVAVFIKLSGASPWEAVIPTRGDLRHYGGRLREFLLPTA